MTVALVVVCKEPASGRAKTRLVPELGAEGARDVATALLADSLDALACTSEPGADVIVYHDPPDAAPRLARAGFRADRFLAQPVGDLGRRLRYGFDVVLGDGYESCVILAADSPFLIPGIGSMWLPRTRDEIVLGPCLDGGYWFVALGQPAPIFEIEMSHADVLEETVAAADACGRSVRLLDPALDIDTSDDLERARELGLLELAPRTRRAWESARPRAAY